MGRGRSLGRDRNVEATNLTPRAKGPEGQEAGKESDQEVKVEAEFIGPEPLPHACSTQSG